MIASRRFDRVQQRQLAEPWRPVCGQDSRRACEARDFSSAEVAARFVLMLVRNGAARAHTLRIRDGVAHAQLRSAGLRVNGWQQPA
jgi:hypothetical protein